jgi:2-phosphoglycerate kinase
MVNSARMRGVPVIEHIDLDNSLSEVIDHVLRKALEVAASNSSVTRSDDKLMGQAVEALEKTTREKEGSVRS